MLQNENSNNQSVPVEMRMVDGRRLVGKIVVPYGSQLVKQINSSNRFLEFEDMDGASRFVSKEAVQEIAAQTAKKPPKLAASKAMESDNPYVVLGVEGDASHDQIRSAYARLAKKYHPDQFNAVVLPDEVATYMIQMFERISSAYQQLSRRETADAAE